MSAWSIDVKVAGHTWTVTDLDPATPGPTAPLTIRHALPEDELWPAQPLPQVATFGLVAVDAADLSDVVKGAPASLALTAAPNPDPVVFGGTVTDVEMSPARFRPDPDDHATTVDGVRVSVTAVGYLAQLWEETVTVSRNDFPGARDRLYDLFEDTPWPDGPQSPWLSGFDTNYFDNYATGANYEIDGESLGPYLAELLRLWLWDHDDTGELTRFVIAPNLDPVTRELMPGADAWRLDPVSNVTTLTPIADLEETPEGWGVVPAGGTIDTGLVDRDARFTQRKGDLVNKVVMPYYRADESKIKTTSVSNGDTPSVAHMLGNREKAWVYVFGDAEVDQIAKGIAGFYLPPAASDAWGADTVMWRMGRDEPGRLPPALGELVVLAPIPETQNPNGRSWHVGLVRSWTLTLPDETVELQLAAPQGHTTPGPGRLAWSDLPAAVTWDQLRPDHTWNDADLLQEGT